MTQALWDPLVWYLKLKEWVIRARGFNYLRADMNGHRFGYYYRDGDRSLPTLVLIHGLAIFPEWWSPLLPRLTGRHPICIPELLGFGRSPGRTVKPEDFTLALYSEQIAHLKEKLGWDQAILSGISLGGWVSMQYALENADAVKGLVLIGPAGADPDVREEDLMTLKEVFDYHDAAGYRHLMNDYVLHRPRWIPGIMGTLALARGNYGGHAHLLNNLVFEDWIGSRVFGLDMPVAMVWGRDDKVFPFSTGRKLVKGLASSKLIPLNDTGHSYLFETPETSSQAILEGLQFVEKAQTPVSDR